MDQKSAVTPFPNYEQEPYSFGSNQSYHARDHSKNYVVPPPYTHGAYQNPYADHRPMNSTDLYSNGQCTPRTSSPLPSSHLDHNGYSNQHAKVNSSYSPAKGFTKLPPRFYIWTRTTAKLSGSVLVDMGERVFKDPEYTVKFSSWSSTNDFVDRSDNKVASASSKRAFSGQSTLEFGNVKTTMSKGRPNYSFSASLPGGAAKTFEWRAASGAPSTDSTFKEVSSLILVPQDDSSHGGGNYPQPLAVWHSASQHVRSNKELGMFEFQGPAANGSMGDEFMTLVIISLVRIYYKQYENAVTLASSAVAVAAS